MSFKLINLIEQTAEQIFIKYDLENTSIQFHY